VRSLEVSRDGGVAGIADDGLGQEFPHSNAVRRVRTQTATNAPVAGSTKRIRTVLAGTRSAIPH
jgi:hypothetical protein